jgi:DNA-directed RNA polymerase sigma subunit (sigma70/sigma32)
LRPEQVTLIAAGLGVAANDVVDMNRRLSGDISLNVSVNQDGDSGEWQDRLVDETSDQESRLAESEESGRRSRALKMAVKVLDDRERHIFEARRLIDRRADSASSLSNIVFPASGSDRSRRWLFRRCKEQRTRRARRDSIHRLLTA